MKLSFTDFFIHRPVFAWVANIILILLGITAFFQLVVRQYPPTEGTIITVRTAMDASAKVVETQVTKPLEDGLASLQGLNGMESETQRGESKITLTFEGRSLDAAYSDVLDAVSRVSLQDEIKPIITKGDVDATSIMELALTGENIPLFDLYDIAERTLKSNIESVDGVATVEVDGGSDLQMKITLDPVKMAAYHVSVMDVVSALRKHNFQHAAGRIKEVEREFMLTAQARLKTPEEFANIIVAKYEDKPIHIFDIGKVKICPGEEFVKVFYNSKPAVGMTIRPQANANLVDISKKIRDKIDKIRPTLPKNLNIHVAIDKAVFIQDSISQVYRALAEAVVLVLVVIFIFLRSLNASLIPLITIPISLIGTFFIMYVLGFSINVLSLLALVLAIGLVVDDAIVVLENIYRYIESGKSVFKSALLGTNEIRFSVIAMTLTLIAVYAPIAVAPGIIGKVFKEFALTLAGAVLVSGFVALTLSPAMCARLLKKHHTPTVNQKQNPLLQLFSGIEKFFSLCERSYLQGVRFSLQHKGLVLLLAFLFSATSGLIAFYKMKKELSPAVDEGLLTIKFYPPPSKNLSYIENRSVQLDQLLKKQPAIINRLMTLQTSQESFVQSKLLPWNQRHQSCQDIMQTLKDDYPSVVRGLECYPRCPSGSIIAGRGASQSSISFRILTLRSELELLTVGRRIRRLLTHFPGIEYVDPSEVAQQPGFDIKINRERIGKLGIDPEEVGQMLQNLVKGVNIGKFEKSGKMYPVRITLSDRSRSSLEAISSLFVKGRMERQEVMVPVREIISFEQKYTDPSIDHYMKKRSFNIHATLKPGYSLGNVYLAFKKYVEGNQLLPPGYELEPSGELKRYFKESGVMYLVFGLALLFIFLVMAAQFESFRDPFIIILSVPLALGGAIFSLLLLKNGSLNVYSQIGLITLVGLITKHGILLVDFANQQMASHKSIYHAVLEAARLRLRPILMTTFAMVLGAVPLAVASGAGAEARQQIGTVIVGGMAIGTIFTLFVIPVIYVLFHKEKPVHEVT